MTQGACRNKQETLGRVIALSTICLPPAVLLPVSRFAAMQCIITLLFPFVFGAVWPVVALSWLLFRAPCRIFNGVIYIRGELWIERDYCTPGLSPIDAPENFLPPYTGIR